MNPFTFFAVSLVAIMCMSSSMQCNEDFNQRLCERPNRIYLGPEFAFFQIATDVGDVHVSGHRPFWGLRLGYEYLKPWAFYGAAELSAMNSGSNFSVSNDRQFYTGRSGAGFGNIEARFGYTLSELLMTPYLGLGVYSLSKRGHNGFKESFGYLAGGLRMQYAFASISSLGLNVEVFRTLGVRQTVQLDGDKTVKHTNGWGCTIGLPLIVRLSRGWDVQWIPYYSRLLFSQTQNIYGNTLLFSYRF